MVALGSQVQRSIIKVLIIFTILINLIGSPILILNTSALITASQTMATSGKIVYPNMVTTRYIVANDGSGDYTNIQTAINSIPIGNYGDIYIKKGIYILSKVNPQIKLRSNIRIHGDGIGVTILKRSSTLNADSGLDMISNPAGVNLENVLIEDLTLDGNLGPDPPNSGGYCIGLSHNQNDVHKKIVFRNVEAKNARGGFIGRNLIGSSWTDFGVIVENCKSSNIWTACDFINSQYVKVIGNDFEDAGGDLIFPETTTSYLGGGGDGANHHWIIDSNYLKNAGDCAIDITSQTSDGIPWNTDMTVTNNKVVTGNVRITGSDGVIIQGNVVYNGDMGPLTYYKKGISSDAGQGGARNIIIKNNKVQPGNEKIGIYIQQNFNVVCTGNTIYIAPGSGSIALTQSGLTGTNTITGNIIISEAMPSYLYQP